MAINYAALKAEISTDPRGYGFQTLLNTGNQQGVADNLNTIRNGTNPPANPTAVAPVYPSSTRAGVANGLITVRRRDVERRELLDAIDVRDFITTANNLQAAWFESITQSDDRIQLSNDDATDTRTFANLKLAVGNTQGSQTRMAALASRNGSRAEELLGPGTILGQSDIALALAS